MIEKRTAELLKSSLAFRGVDSHDLESLADRCQPREVKDGEWMPVSAFLRKGLAPLFRRWPLLICRSPLSNACGLVLPKDPCGKAH